MQNITVPRLAARSLRRFDWPNAPQPNRPRGQISQRGCRPRTIILSHEGRPTFRLPCDLRAYGALMIPCSDDD